MIFPADEDDPRPPHPGDDPDPPSALPPRDPHDTPPSPQPPGETHLLCHRCGCSLTAGEGNFYVVRIEAFADPSPPNLTWDDSFNLDVGEEIDRLIEQMRDMSERELMDQVYRRVTIHLCGPCYRQWIEDPAR